MIYTNPNIRASSRDGYVIATFIADTVAELPPRNYLTDYTLEIGSTCHVIEDSGDYEMQSNGTWVKRIPAVLANTYTRAEIDSKIADVNSDIDILAGLQATDRQIIIDMINSGAKNIANMTLSSFTTATKDGVTVSLSDDTIITSGNSGTSGNSFYNVFYNGNSALLPDGDWVASLYGTGIENFRIEVYDNVTGDVVKGQFGVPFHFSIPTGVSQSFLRITQKPSATCTGSFKLMITPQFIYNATPDFRPYCPTLQQLYAMVQSYHGGV